jgi:hypothetical protein
MEKRHRPKVFAHCLLFQIEHSIWAPWSDYIQGSIVIVDNDKTGCQVYVFEIFDEIWVCFRGTTIRDTVEAFRKDLNTDLNFKQSGSEYLPEDNRVHTGFNESYLSVREKVWKEVECRIAFIGEKPIRIIGHSLGAALATLMAIDIRSNRKLKKTVSLRTFGSPCVGNPSFVQHFSKFIKDSKRYAIYMDPVPLLLSEIQALGYAHVEEKILMTEMRRKHNIEWYIKVLCRWAHVDDDIDEDENEEIMDIEEEEIIHGFRENQNFNLLILGGTMLFAALILYKRYNINKDTLTL